MAVVIRIQSETKRAILRQIAKGAKDSTTSLKDALIAVQGKATDASFLTGRLLISTSGNGQSASFQISTAGFTQDVFVGLTEELINILEDAVANGASEDAAQIDALFMAMCGDDRLQGVRVQHGDFTSLRFPVTR